MGLMEQAAKLDELERVCESFHGFVDAVRVATNKGLVVENLGQVGMEIAGRLMAAVAER